VGLKIEWDTSVWLMQTAWMYWGKNIDTIKKTQKL
jgi:hypothetical protein